MKLTALVYRSECKKCECFERRFIDSWSVTVLKALQLGNGHCFGVPLVEVFDKQYTELL